MLTMSFIPHHHHRHNICMQEMCDNKQHSDSPNTCCVGCITYFQCQQQQNYEKILLYELSGVIPYDFNDLNPRLYEIHSFQTIIDHSYGFRTQWKRMAGVLRAPPFIV